MVTHFCPNMPLGVVKTGKKENLHVHKKWACTCNFCEPNFVLTKTRNIYISTELLHGQYFSTHWKIYSVFISHINWFNYNMQHPILVFILCYPNATDSQFLEHIGLELNSIGCSLWLIRSQCFPWSSQDSWTPWCRLPALPWHMMMAQRRRCRQPSKSSLS